MGSWKLAARVAMHVLTGAMLCLMAACSPAKVHIDVNSEVSTHTFSKVMVWSQFRHGFDNRLAEKIACEQIVRKTPCECVGFSEVILRGVGTSTASEDGAYPPLTDADAVICFSLKGSTDTIEVKPPNWRTVGVGQAARSVVTLPGPSHSVTAQDVEAMIFVTEGVLGQPVVHWYATARLEGTQFTKNDDLVIRSVNSIVAQLAREKVLR